MQLSNFSNTILNYGPALPRGPVSDGSLFFKTTAPIGLYLFSFSQDTNTGVIGDQVGSGWVLLASTSGVDAATLDGLDSTAFQPVDDDLTALAGMATTGFVSRTAAGTFSTRTLTPGLGVLITNQGGVAGNPVFSISESALTLNNIGGTLSVGKGGTGNGAYTANAVLAFNGSTFSTLASTGALGQVLTSAGGASLPTWGSNTVTIGSTAIALGGTATTIAGLTQITSNTVLGTTATFSGTLTAGSVFCGVVNGSIGNFSGSVSGSSFTTAGSVVGTSGNFSSSVTSSSFIGGVASFTGLTINGGTQSSGAISANAFYARNLGAPQGSAYLETGGAGTSGIVGFGSGASGTRQGYIGNSSTNASLDTGTVAYVAGTHDFFGTVRVNNNLNVTGGITTNGAATFNSSISVATTLSVGGATGISGALTVGTSITAGGDITAFSDERTKTNIRTIPNALEKVLWMRGVQYTRISDNEECVGVIAQEVQEVLPEVVREQQDGMLSVAYGNMVGVLIEAIREQQFQIVELQDQVKALLK